ncbi:protein inturned-like [Pomacea canaliculata]|uniref:protein inturned-like n=1 Tax=Pomacea canaliculata TaxID=400727 RepID=UPI000D73AF50|nr:protein inturned-like [Pomacea canaliculata]XP_025086439.1 protein inturned-like [Pomacea canaliculata]XP_025086440.1 protein inturned-like [Pomacea canaliculata]XP_025086441.1 protein inturned-like [Pomacea canaliculata]XP_025086442.1 protein inturned-like [Pomacea canaliculata]XP_025086443.1 protein inturned-like [Pomacea canaliculata]XP_025086444.1 protein inturned-like [Pomacea canaliculata]
MPTQHLFRLHGASGVQVTEMDKGSDHSNWWSHVGWTPWSWLATGSFGHSTGKAHPQSQDDKEENAERSRNQQVVIKGLTPDGPAIRNKELLIGDHISSINGRKITWNNLESVANLLNGTRKVRLVVERTNNQSSSPRDRNTLLLNTANITKFLSHSSTSGHRSGNCHLHLNGMHVLYMSMDGVSSDHAEQKEDILYKFPKQDSILSELRGLYYTLTHLLTDDNVANSTLLALVIGGKVVNIYCCKEGKDLLIVAAPADRVLTHQLKTLVKNVQRLLRCLFGSVELAFRSSQHHSAIDDFLGFLISFLSPSFKMGKYIRSRHAMYGYIAYLPLPGDIQMAISSTLTEFESAEFANMSETFYGCRRMFTILGSLVFYKGHALCSHLGQEDTVDIFFYLTHAGLLHLTARHRLHQLLVWQEIFPTRLCHDVTDTNSVFGYSEPYARWFLMVVGMKNLLLATLLEAGGCAAQIEGTCLPDPFYVDQARATALHLQSGDIISACERRLCGEGLPPTVKVDKLTSTHSTSTPVIRRFEHLIKSPTSISLNFGSNISSLPALSNNTLPAGCSLGNSPTRHEWRKISSESNVSVGNSNSGEQLFKAASGILGPHYPPAEYNLVPITCPPFVVDSDVNIFKLGSGKDNTVLIYCQLNRHESSLFSSSGSFNSDAPSSLQRQLVDNFWRCCAMIHADFVKSIHRKTNRGECLLSDFEADCTLSSCREQGVMFMITSHDTTDNRKPLSLAYWVVGRKLWYPQLREIFVCFHESTPQNIVELAFRLSAGNLELA